MSQTTPTILHSNTTPLPFREQADLQINTQKLALSRENTQRVEAVVLRDVAQMDTIAIPAVKRPGRVQPPMVSTNAVLRDGWRILTHTDTYTQPKAPHALLRAALFDYLFTQESEILTLPLYLYLSPDMQYWLCLHPTQECDGQLYYTHKRPIAIVSDIRGREEYFPSGLPECVSNRDVLLLGPAA